MIIAVIATIIGVLFVVAVVVKMIAGYRDMVEREKLDPNYPVFKKYYDKMEDDKRRRRHGKTVYR